MKQVTYLCMYALLLCSPMFGMNCVFNNAFARTTKQCNKEAGKWLCQALRKEVTVCPIESQGIGCCRNLAHDSKESMIAHASVHIAKLNHETVLDQKHTKKLQ